MSGLRDRLAVLFGVWACCVFAPPLSFELGGPFDGSVTVVDAGLIGGLLGLGTLGAKVGLQRVDDPARRFRKGGELAGVLGVAGIVLLAAFGVSYTHGFVAAIPFGVGGAVGFGLAFLIAYVADRAIVVRSRAETDSRLTWSAKRRPETGRIRYLQTVTAVVAVGLVIWNISNGTPKFALLWVLIGGLQFGDDIVRKLHRRRYEILDAGLVTTFGHLPWEDFDGYRLTDDELVLHGNVWPFGTVAYDRESVDDLDAVVDALDRYLPRLESDHDEPSVIGSLRREILS